jgi:hypothetical protein
MVLVAEVHRFRFPFPFSSHFISAEVGVEYILLYHTMGIEERPVQGDAMEHHVNEMILIPVKKRQNGLLQFFVKGCGIICRARGSFR